MVLFFFVSDTIVKCQQGRHQHWVRDELADNSLYLVTATK